MSDENCVTIGENYQFMTLKEMSKAFYVRVSRQ